MDYEELVKTIRSVQLDIDIILRDFVEIDTLHLSLSEIVCYSELKEVFGLVVQVGEDCVEYFVYKHNTEQPFAEYTQWNPEVQNLVYNHPTLERFDIHTELAHGCLNSLHAIENVRVRYLELDCLWPEALSTNPLEPIQCGLNQIGYPNSILDQIHTLPVNHIAEVTDILSQVGVAAPIL